MYLDLQNKARRDRRPFDELLALYTLEGFLVRLSGSAHVDNLVLKGGLLLAAYDARRPTRDADFAARNLTNQVPVVTELVQGIARIGLDDGLTFDAASARGETIREEDLYSGVRVHLNCELASANTHLKVDVNVGDPITPGPQRIHIPRLLEPTSTIDLVGYPLHMVHAEKIVTALQRGTANTRWRDFADIYLLCQHHTVTGIDLQQALTTVANHRGVALGSLNEMLNGYAAAPGVQVRWANWRRKQQLDDRLPESFADVLKQAFVFADPALEGAASDRTWQPAELAWASAAREHAHHPGRDEDENKPR